MTGVGTRSKNRWGVPRGTKNWTLKDRDKNGIWSQKDLILVPQKIVLVLVDEKKYTLKSCSILIRSEMGSKRWHIYVSPNIEGVPSPGIWVNIGSGNGLVPLSDLKLNEIHASRVCNFVNFQVRLESSRPHKSLCQQSCCQRIWNSTF